MDGNTDGKMGDGSVSQTNARTGAPTPGGRSISDRAQNRQQHQRLEPHRLLRSSNLSDYYVFASATPFNTDR